MATTTNITRPAPFIEALGQTYADMLTRQIGKPVKTAAFAPQVAPETALQRQARSLASGLGGYQPYLTGAGRLAGTAERTLGGIPTDIATARGQLGTAAGDIAAARGMIGPTAYQAYMSPYQQDVISTTLQEFDVQAQKGIPALQSRAIQAGAFGGGREGVALGEYQAASDRNRAALQAQLLQQGFGQAQQLAGQAFGQQQQLAQAQAGLAQLQPQLLGQQIGTLGTLGGQQQAQQQAILDAQRQAAETAAYEPYQRLGFFGTGVTGLMGGYPGQYQFTQTPQPSPLQTALGVGSTLAGIYRTIKGPFS